MDAINHIHTVCACITISSCVLFFIYVLVQSIRKPRILFRFMSLRILVYIQISEMLSSIADLYSYGTESHSLCLIEAFQTQLFEITAMFWTLCLSIFIFSVVVFNLQQKKRLEIIFHVSCV
jgi:hypothetical protein